MSQSRSFKARWQRSIRDSDLAYSTKLVLYTLSTYVDGDKIDCLPSIETISEGSGLGRTCVFKHIKIAKEHNWLAVNQDKKNGKGWRKNSYTLLFGSSLDGQNKSPSPRGGRPPEETPKKKKVREVNTNYIYPEPQADESDKKSSLTAKENVADLSNVVSFQRGAVSCN